MRKLVVVFVFLGSFILLTSFINSAFAGVYTRYPIYDMGTYYGDGRNDGNALYQEYDYADITNGTTKLMDAVDASLPGGGGYAESQGWMGISWTCPPPRDGGGCPYISEWKGSEYALDNNLLPSSENSLGDVKDSYVLQKPLLDVGGHYKLQLSEFENEHDYIDQVKLMAVDHPKSTSIAATQNGEIITYKNPLSPRSCLDNNGANRLSEISRMDGNVSCPTTYFQGYSGDWLVLDFGTVTSSHANIIFRDDQKCAGDNCIDLQVPSANGGWHTVDVLNPRDYWSVEAVSMHAYTPANGDFIIRLLWTQTHRLDYVGLDTSLQIGIHVHLLGLLSATHSTGGDVTSRLLCEDQQFAELLPGQEVELTFNASKDSSRSSKILYVVGHYSKNDPNDPVVTVTSKLSLNGYANLIAFSVYPFTTTVSYDFQVWLEVTDVNTNTINTKTLMYEKTDQAVGDQIKSNTWNYDQDFTATFSATVGHKYVILIGVYTNIVGVTLGLGQFDGRIDFSEDPNNYILTRYITLAWS